MTLITYLTRVHFADGVLEDALWSELEAGGKRRPLILADKRLCDGDLAERFFSGIPVRSTQKIWHDIPLVTDERTALDVAAAYWSGNCDVIVAFGGGKTIDLAKIARVAIANPDVPLAKFSCAHNASRLAGSRLPDLFVAAGISGLRSAVSAHAPLLLGNGERVVLSFRKLVPDLIICDPTMTIQAGRRESASAGADAITHCIEAYISRSYNPPAEGIALDGLTRAVRNLRSVLENRDDIGARREMMAASLNGALALQKGFGASHAIANALGFVSRTELDHGSINRVTLPVVLRFNESAVGEKYDVLKQVFGIPTGTNLADGLDAYFADLPLPHSLSALGLNDDDLAAAAPVAAHDLATGTNPRSVGASDYLSIMQSVH